MTRLQLKEILDLVCALIGGDQGLVEEHFDMIYAMVDFYIEANAAKKKLQEIKEKSNE